ncbi:Uncharacterized protein OBRU01_12969 [Operophtera brumata]|uniref:HAT C-terminal dimerisation domain-containing protein n=1 Tax=Operophtera brumata TaxID=104452 RepID=A0A0L7KXG0_OPEBR|nr:Uncharacterized protein OBRU01_12969 [Operophtera brumata]
MAGSPFQQWNDVLSSDKFWGEVAAFTDAAGERKFSSLSALVMGILSLPFSNASVERAFSIMNVVKQKLRNKMQSSTADHIIRVRANAQHDDFVELLSELNE